MSRHERKKRQKELKKLAKEIDANGLGAEPNLMRIAAITHNTLSILGNENLPSRSGAAMKYLYGLYEKSLLRASSNDKLACEKGCSYCCHFFVSASAPQVFSIASYIRENSTDPTDLEAEIERIRPLEKATRGLDQTERLSGKHPCVLLVDGQCSVYSVRPTACRAFCSLSLEVCERFWSGEGKVDDVPVPEFAFPLRKGYDQALWASLHHLGLRPYGYDLNHAVLVALENPAAEEAWFRGEDVFGNVARDRDEIKNPFPSELEKLFWTVILSLSRGEIPPPNPFGV